MTSLAARSRLASAPARGRWLIAWVGGAALGVVNGIVRDKVYGRIGERRAHQVSTATLIAALGAYFWALDIRWPTSSAAQALRIGAAWVGLTVGFEVALGRVGPDR